jgi:hypothetical protein
VRQVNEKPLMSVFRSIRERGESVNELAKSKEQRVRSKKKKKGVLYSGLYALGSALP